MSTKDTAETGGFMRITANRMKPVVGKTFAFGEAREALKYMERGSHFGRIVIQF